MRKKFYGAWWIGEGVKKLTLTVPAVTYQDGRGGTVFGSQTTLCILGGRTPAFIGNPKRDGYVFKGWSPEVAEKVTGDAVYTAQWEECPIRLYSDGALENGEQEWESILSAGTGGQNNRSAHCWKERKSW